MANRQNYCLPMEAKLDPTAMSTTERLTTRYYQVITGHVVIGVHLKCIKASTDDRCWWCHSGKRRTVKYLIKECQQWREGRERLKKTVKRHLCQNHDLKYLFADRDCTKPILKYLEETEVGNRTPEKEIENREEERDENVG
jgi:hypothetical protein